MISIAPLSKSLATKDKTAQLLDSVIDSVFHVTEKEAYRFEARASALPFCTMLELQQFITGEQWEKDFPFEFYVKVGTAMHEVLQASFPKSKNGSKVFGNWVCSNHISLIKPCEYRKTMSLRPDSLVCPKCKAGQLVYDELTLQHISLKDRKTAVTAHCDMVTVFGKKKKKKYVVWEFKSTGAYNIDYPDKWLPYTKHLFQAWAYAVMMTDIGMRPSYIAIAYFSRDKATRGNASVTNSFGITNHNNAAKKTFKGKYFKVTDEGLAVMRKILDNTVESKRIADMIVSRKPGRVKKLLKLSKLRPCHSEKDYKNVMKHHFFSNENCPFAKSEHKGGCFTDNPKVEIYKRLLKSTKTHYKAA